MILFSIADPFSKKVNKLQFGKAKKRSNGQKTTSFFQSNMDALTVLSIWMIFLTKVMSWISAFLKGKKKGGSRKSEISIVEGLDSLAKRGTFSFARLLPHDVAWRQHRRVDFVDVVEITFQAVAGAALGWTLDAGSQGHLSPLATTPKKLLHNWPALLVSRQMSSHHFSNKKKWRSQRKFQG